MINEASLKRINNKTHTHPPTGLTAPIKMVEHQNTCTTPDAPLQPRAMMSSQSKSATVPPSIQLNPPEKNKNKVQLLTSHDGAPGSVPFLNLQRPQRFKRHCVRACVCRRQTRILQRITLLPGSCLASRRVKVLRVEGTLEATALLQPTGRRQGRSCGGEVGWGGAGGCRDGAKWMLTGSSAPLLLPLVLPQ